MNRDDLARDRASKPSGSSNEKVNEEWAPLHRVFHRTLIIGCGSEWLVRFHDMLFDQSERYRYLSAAYEQIDRHTRDTTGEHAAIVHATGARDA